MVREDAGEFRAGTRVAAAPVIGDFAEMVAVDTAKFSCPERCVPYDQGAAIPLTYLTADYALHRRTRLAAGETVLMHGGRWSRGAYQPAGRRPWRTSARGRIHPDKGDVAQATGGYEGLPVDGFRDEVRRLTGGRGVHVVVDRVGGDRFTASLRAR